MSVRPDDLPIQLGKNPYKVKIRWLIILRVIVITLLLGSISIFQIRYGIATLTPFYILVAITYLLTILYSVLYFYLNNLLVFGYIQLAGDILIEICLVYFTGGIESPFSFTFIVSIITASIILSRKGSLIIASMSSILYGLLLDLQYFGILSLPSSYIPESIALNSVYVFHTIFVNICAFFLAALLSGYLAESRKKADQKIVAQEKDLIELRAFNEDVIKNIRSGLIVTDLRGRVTLANKSAIEILGIRELTPDQELFWAGLFVPIDFHGLIHSLEAQSDHIIKYNEFIKCGESGACFLGITISYLKDAKGNTKGIITCFQDLTEFKKMEEQIKQAEILSTIGSMAAGIAHELRNPLASIKGSIQILAEDLNLNKEQARLMEIILHESSHLNNIINEFLTYARPKPPACEICDLHSLINDTLTILKNAEDFNPNIDISIDFEHNNACVCLDMNQIKQVLWNLAINACQAMPNGGTLFVKCLTKTNTNQSYKIIEFCDTGIGISKDCIAKIFHPFYTTKERGTGLGLCTAYRIIEGHGGKIEVESNPGKGSLFRICLPT